MIKNKADSLLRNCKTKILDVALDYVFDSHEGFTRAFTKAFGINPKKYANYPMPEGWRGYIEMIPVKKNANRL